MDVVVMKHMASNFAKLNKFKGVDFKRWQKKMHFLLSSMSVVCVLTTPILEDGGDDPTVKQVRKRAKWENDNYVCRGLILNGMSDSLFDIYQNVKSSKELWNSLEAKYMAQDASSKKFLVSNFTNYKITDSRPVLEQYNELLDFKHTLKHLKEELTLVELGSHLRIKESLRVQDSDKPKGNNVAGPSVVNMVKHKNSSMYNDNKGKRKHHDTKADPNKKYKVTCWKYGKPGHLKKDCKAGNIGNKANGSGTKGLVDGSSNSLNGQNMFDKSFQGARVQWKFQFPLHSCSLAGSTSAMKVSNWGGRLHFREVEEQICKFEKPQGAYLHFSLMARISTIRLLIAMASIYNLIIHQMDVKTTFLNGDLDEEVYMNQPQGFIMSGNENKVCKLIKSLYGLKQAHNKFDKSGKGVIICLYVGDMLIFGTDQVQVDLTKEFLSSRFSMKDIGEADVILVSTPMDTSKKLMPNNGQAVSQLEYSRVIGCLMYAMTCTRPDIAFVVGKLMLEGYTDASCISNNEDNSSITLAAAGKEAEWLKNLLLEIPLWSKPITPISIRCDSVATLVKDYSQMYNGKSRHLGVRHSMICELIKNGMISIEFMRSQQNLADHLTKGLARDLVIKSAEEMGLKSNSLLRKFDS
ncbi:zinc finger, CCHC-type containing protein [Tanacetum coccineum]